MPLTRTPDGLDEELVPTPSTHMSIDQSFNPQELETISALVIGAGNRAHVYVKHRQIRVVGVADPVPAKRANFVSRFGIQPSHVFGSWEEAATVPKFADCVIIATPDREHTGPAIAFAKLGYHVLLEKPMAVSLDDCWNIARDMHCRNNIFAVCHVLRYMFASRKIKELITTGRVGEVLHIDLTEPVGYWHFAHSFVRGNWGNTAESTFSLLSKCCHDVDLLYWWLNGEDNPCRKVSSFGSLQHFSRNRKPSQAGHATRCVDCPVNNTCIYSAKKIYMERAQQGDWGWPINAVVQTDDIEDLETALREGPYGRCVYECQNDVADHQVVNFEFANGATCSMKMVATSEKLCDRQVHVYGSQGEIRCWGLNENKVTYIDFSATGSGRVQVFEDQNRDIGEMGGHGGADYFFTQAFVDAVTSGDQSRISTGARESLMSHELVFLAEKSRREGRVVVPQHEHNKYARVLDSNVE